MDLTVWLPSDRDPSGRFASRRCIARVMFTPEASTKQMDVDDPAELAEVDEES